MQDEFEERYQSARQTRAKEDEAKALRTRRMAQVRKTFVARWRTALQAAIDAALKDTKAFGPAAQAEDSAPNAAYEFFIYTRRGSHFIMEARAALLIRQSETWIRAENANPPDVQAANKLDVEQWQSKRTDRLSIMALMHISVCDTDSNGTKQVWLPYDMPVNGEPMATFQQGIVKTQVMNLVGALGRDATL